MEVCQPGLFLLIGGRTESSIQQCGSWEVWPFPEQLPQKHPWTGGSRFWMTRYLTDKENSD
jgi:hypothetical protein